MQEQPSVVSQPNNLEQPVVPQSAGTYESNPLKLAAPAFLGLKLNIITIIKLMLAAVGAYIGFGLLIALLVVLAATNQGNQSVGIVVFLGGALLVLAFMLFVIIVALPAQTRVAVAMGRGRAISFRDSLRIDTNLALRLFVTGLLTALAVLGGLILLVIPGLIFLVWFSYALYLAYEQNVGAVEAMRRSRELVRGRFWDTVGALSLTSAIGVLAWIPLLGVLASLAQVVIGILYGAVPMVRYAQLTDAKPAAGAPTHGWNYALFAAALIGIFAGSGSSVGDFEKLQQQLQNPTATIAPRYEIQ